MCRTLVLPLLYESTYRFRASDLSVKPFGLDKCNKNAISSEASISFDWEIIKSVAAGERNKNVPIRNKDICTGKQPCTTNYGRKLLIPPFWLPSCPGLAEVHVTVKQQMGKQARLSSAPVLTKIPLQLRVPGVRTIVAGISESVGFDDSITLDASASFDLARGEGNSNHLEFLWTCVELSNTSCRTTSTKPLTFPDGNRTKLKFVPRELRLAQDQQYAFRVTVMAQPLCPVPSPTTVCTDATRQCLASCLHLLHCVDNPGARGCRDTAAIAACRVVGATYPSNNHRRPSVADSGQSSRKRVLKEESTSGAADSVSSACGGNTKKMQGKNP